MGNGMCRSCMGCTLPTEVDISNDQGVSGLPNVITLCMCSRTVHRSESEHP